jgi:hypothetical protein
MRVVVVGVVVVVGLVQVSLCLGGLGIEEYPYVVVELGVVVVSLTWISLCLDKIGIGKWPYVVLVTGVVVSVGIVVVSEVSTGVVVVIGASGLGPGQCPVGPVRDSGFEDKLTGSCQWSRGHWGGRIRIRSRLLLG